MKNQTRTTWSIVESIEKGIVDFVMGSKDDTIFLNRFFSFIRTYDGTDIWMDIYQKYNSLLYTGKITREEMIKDVDEIRKEITPDKSNDKFIKSSTTPIMKQVFQLDTGDIINEGIILHVSRDSEDNRITHIKTTKGTYNAYTFGYIQTLKKEL